MRRRNIVPAEAAHDCLISHSIIMIDRFFALPLSQWSNQRALRMLALLGSALSLAMAGCSELALKERELVFRVVDGEASWYSGLPEGVIETNLEVAADGKNERLHAWWWPASRSNAPAVLYLHGSRWNLTGQLFRIEQLHDFGFSVLAIDYRGFGQSDGDLPSEKTVYEDAAVA